jgi:hypothetical protein
VSQWPRRPEGPAVATDINCPTPDKPQTPRTCR